MVVGNRSTVSSKVGNGPKKVKNRWYIQYTIVCTNTRELSRLFVVAGVVSINKDLKVTKKFSY